MALDPPETLSCGRDPMAVLDAARADTVDDHSRTCPFCQAVVRGDLLAERGADRIRSEPAIVPDTLLPRIMSTVWSELRPGHTLPVPTRYGTAFATERAAVSLLQDDLDRMPDFQVHLCRIHQDDDTGSEL